MKSAFTLIELMVVVVIIGVLAAIAIPKFSSMNEQARKASCRSNLHALAVSESIYFAWYGVFTADLTELDAVQEKSSEMRCPSAHGQYPIVLPTDNEYVVRCPGEAFTQHGSVATGCSSWQ